MEDGGAGRGVSDSSVIVTTQYDCAEGGVSKAISLVDAVSPLLGSSSHQLLLSSWPICVPWPLAVDANPAADDSNRESKRRRTEDVVGNQLEQLKDLLEMDIPKALKQLQMSLQGSTVDWLTGSKTSRVVVAEAGKQSKKTGVDWVRLEAESEAQYIDGDTSGRSLSVSPASKIAADQLIHRLVTNETPLGTCLECRNEATAPPTQIYVPPQSAFLHTNILRSQKELPRGWEQLLAFADKHSPSLILLDPPYPNYSAKRLKTKQETYEPVNDLYDLWKMKLPVQQLLYRGSKRDEGVLVGCWVTNHAKIQRFILTKLFPGWGLHHIGQLVWIKVTAEDKSKSIPGGQLVFPLKNKQGRKPYEILLLGHTKDHPLKSQTRLFASVPLGHSRKPAVLDLLQSFLSPSQQLNVYEFFARRLFPGPSPEGYWVSIGNEPLAFSQEGVGYHVNDVRGK
jgi:N6-adenosine-specific RNA methylase IME4